MKKKYLALFLHLALSILMGSSVFAKDDLYKHYEEQLADYLQRAKDTREISQRALLVDNALSLFDTLLGDFESFHYPFIELPVEQAFSHDSSLRIFCWNYLLAGGLHQYYAVVQVYDTNRHYYNHWILREKSILDTSVVTDTNWYGALYYEIISYEHRGHVFYTLLGVDFNNLFTSKRIIDMLQIDYQHDRLLFGAPLFFRNRSWHNRIVFEHSARVAMTLRYSRKDELIIYDNLEPQAIRYRGNYEYYGPDMTFNALRLRFGRWNEIRDVQVGPDTFK